MKVTRQMRRQAQRGKLRVGLRMSSGSGATCMLSSCDELERGELFVGGTRFLASINEFYRGLPVFIQVSAEGEYASG